MHFIDLALRDNEVLHLEGGEMVTQPKRKVRLQWQLTRRQSKSRRLPRRQEEEEELYSRSLHNYKLNEPSNSEEGDGEDPSSLCLTLVIVQS